MLRYLAALLILATFVPIEISQTQQRARVCPDYISCMARGGGLMNLNPALSLAHFQQALRLNPTDPDALAYLHIMEAYLLGERGYCPTYQRCMSEGYASSKAGDYQSALTHFKRALVFNTHSQEAQKAIFTVSRAVQQVANP